MRYSPSGAAYLVPQRLRRGLMTMAHVDCGNRIPGLPGGSRIANGQNIAADDQVKLKSRASRVWKRSSVASGASRREGDPSSSRGLAW